MYLAAQLPCPYQIKKKKKKSVLCALYVFTYTEKPGISQMQNSLPHTLNSDGPLKPPQELAVSLGFLLVCLFCFSPKSITPPCLVSKALFAHFFSRE